MRELILQVNKNDDIIGEIPKEEAHQGNGILHRAFLAMVFDEKERLLLTKRSRLKKLWPDFWDGSIASHPKKGESQEQAAKRRMIEELGTRAEDVKYLFKFHYQIPYKDIGSENEICAVLKVKISGKSRTFKPQQNINIQKNIKKARGKISPNPKEISDCKWMDIENFKKDLKENPEKYAPWLKIGFEKYESEK